MANKQNIFIAQHEAFWADRLSDLEPLTIPYSKQIAEPNHQLLEITKPITQKLTAFLQEHFPNVKQADFLLTSFVCYMARISGMTCFDLGFADIELRQENNGLINLAAHVPCRIEINLEQSISEVLEVVREQIKFVKQHKSYALDIVTRYHILDSVPGIHDGQLLPVVLQLVSNLEEVEAQEMSGRDLTLFIPDSGETICWRYHSEVFDSVSIARMCDQFDTLLQSMVANPQQSLASQSLLPKTERHKILYEWNKSEADLPKDKCLHQLFEEQVTKTPDAIAIVFEDRQLTYRQLNTQANQLAHYLRDLGVAPEVLVGFCMERSLEMIVGLLGILKAGGAYVPLDPAYPRERLSHMLEDAKISILLTKDRLASHLPVHRAQVLCLDSDWEKIAERSQKNPAITTTGENLAYVIYTSGSTGKPKGVMIPHHAISYFSQTAIAEHEILASDRALQFASINFDMAVEEIFTRLLAGSTLILRTDEMIVDLKTFCQTCQDLRLTILNLPTAYWHGLVSELANAEVKLPDSLRMVIVGGEKVLPELVKSWQEYVTKSDLSDSKVSGRHLLQLINGYGPTEATICATVYQIPANADSIVGEVPIGRPFPHLQTYILDRYQQPVPIGVPGELYIGGSSLARGYLNRPELTAEKFIPDFLSQKPGARLYKTGDLVRYLPDGNIEYIGRIDNQVKIRGFRIELGEIETVMARHPHIKETAVIAREDTPGDKRLIAYFVPQQKDFDGSQLRSFLKERLPSYMLPAAFVKLDSLPITPGGKVDRRALPKPDFDRSEIGDFVAPQNDLELKLAEIWAQILKISPIGIKDNFFELGGHSLLAVSLLTQIEKTFEKNIPLATFLSMPTIEELANAISQETSSTSASLIFEIRAAGSKPPLFLINAMGTGMLAYKLLAKYLDPEQPVYGIRAVGMDDNQTPHNRIDQMAEAYIKEIRSVQADGPYFIAGVCTGGTISYEMACQLRSQNQEVAFLGLIDSTARPIPPDILSAKASEKVQNSSPAPAFFERYIKHNFALRGLNNLFAVLTNPQLKVKDKLSFSSDMMQQLSKKIQYKLETITYKNNQNGNLTYAMRRARVFDAGEEALRHFTPQVYAGEKVILIRARDNPEHVDHNYQLGWDEFVTGKLEVYEVPADQTTLLFEPHIRTLAAKLNSCLREVQNSEDFK